jgi:predicted dehydrogenase
MSTRTPLRSTRRDFLKDTGRLTAASMLTAAMGPHVYAAGDEAIRLALVGCGGRGAGAVADAFSAGGGPVKLWAMADVFEGRLKSSLGNLVQSYADRVEVPPERRFVGFDGYRKAIDTLRPGDVAILATHAAFRPLHFEYAVQRGVNVFMEKSFAVDGPAVRRLLKAADASEQKGLKVGVGFMWRHSKAREEVVSRIHDGAVGDVHTMRIYRVHGPVHCPRRPAEMNELAFQIQNATNFTWASAGFFVDWHCHNVDVACWIKDAWPVRAQGFGGRCYPESGNQFDHYTVEYTFEDGAKLFAFSRHMNGCWNTYSDYAHGTKGSALIMAQLHDPRPVIYRSQKMEPDQVVWQYGRPDDNPYVVEWQLLLDAIRAGREYNEARRAAMADAVALMGRIATHTGQYITQDQVLNSDVQFVTDIDNMTFDTPAPIHEGPDGLYAAPQPGITKEC